MGTWGISISSNDTFADVYDDFFALYNDGLDVDKISKRLNSTYREVIDDSEDSNNFWFALAKAQWECKSLDKAVYSRVKEIVDSDADIEIWRQLAATEKDLKKRREALQKFLEGISIEREKAKVRKKKKEPKIAHPTFQKGDCVTFKLDNGNYGGAIVLEAIYDSTNPFVNLITATRINQAEKPTVKNFEKSTVIIQNFAAFKNSPNIHWFTPLKQNVIDLLEIVGQLKVEKTYLHFVNRQNEYGFCNDFDVWIIGQANRQFAFEKGNSKSDKIITIKELIKTKKWKL